MIYGNRLEFRVSLRMRSHIKANGKTLELQTLLSKENKIIKKCYEKPTKLRNISTNIESYPLVCFPITSKLRYLTLT